MRTPIAFIFPIVALSSALLLTTLSHARAESSVSSQTEKAPTPIAEPKIFTYRQLGNQSLKAYVFLPRDSGSARPAILMFHDGAWKLGEAAWLFGRAAYFHRDRVNSYRYRAFGLRDARPPRCACRSHGGVALCMI